MPMAPLVLVADGTVLEVLLGFFEAVVVVTEGADVGPTVEEVRPPRGAVDCPAICDRTAAENVPVILSRL